MKRAIKIPLNPYIGHLTVAPTRAEYERLHMSIFGEPDKLNKAQTGRFSAGSGKKGDLQYLIWAKNRNSLVHELSHVVLDLFEITGIDPRGCQGEPFCYMLCHLLGECK